MEIKKNNFGINFINLIYLTIMKKISIFTKPNTGLENKKNFWIVKIELKINVWKFENYLKKNFELTKKKLNYYVLHYLESWLIG